MPKRRIRGYHGALPLGIGEPVLITAVKENSYSKLKSALKLSKNAGLHAGLLATEVDSQSRTALHWAVISDHVVMTQMLVSTCDVEAEDIFGRTSLFYAVESQEFPIALVEILLQNGASVNHVDKIGKTPLSLALERENIYLSGRIARRDKVTLLNLASRCGKDHGEQHDMVRMIETALRCGIDIHVTNEIDRTILHTAAATGCLAIIKLMIPKKVMAEKQDLNGETALSLAASGGWRDVVEHLLTEWEADLETTTRDLWTPLHRAAAHGHLEVVQILLERGANPLARTRPGLAPLFTACVSREDEVGALLLERVTVPTAVQLRDNEGFTLARIAATNNCAKVMLRLVEHAKQDEDYGHILWEKFDGCSHAFVAIREDCQDTAMVLLNAGAAVEGLDSTGNTALHCAALNGNVALCTWLLQHSLHADDWAMCKNRNQHTPVQIAASDSNGDVMSTLLQHQDPKRVEGISTAGWTALHWAAWYERLDLVRLLIMGVADVRAKDNNGKTASDIVKHLKTVSMELVEWLTLADSHEQLEVMPLIGRPVVSEEAKAVCQEVSGFLMGFYNGRTIEKAGFSIFDILYRYGPDEIISIAAKARRIDDRMRLRWIHLPVNNKLWLKDLLHSIYFDLGESWILGNGSWQSSSCSSSTSASEVSDNSQDSIRIERKLGFSPNELASSATDVHDRTDRYDKVDNVEETVFDYTPSGEQTSFQLPARGKVRFVDAAPERTPKNVDRQFDHREGAPYTFDQGSPVPVIISQRVDHNDDGKGNSSVQARASYQHSKLQSFIEECLHSGSDSRHPQFVAPFIKFLAVDDPAEVYDTESVGIRVGLSIPYFAFTRVRNQSSCRQAMHTVDDISGQKPSKNTPESSEPNVHGLNTIRYYEQHHKGMLHVPQSLDEFYYQYLVDADSRAAGQVLYRHQGLPGRSLKGSDRYICVVDQFWLYALDDGTIVTSCSNHLNKDMMNLQEMISTHIKYNTNMNIGFDSVYGMIPLMLAVLIRKTIECEFGETRERLLDVFAEAIARTANRHVELFAEFKEALTTEESLVKRGKEATSRDIREEIKLLEEVNDILDELNIVKSVLLSQASILDEYADFLRVAAKDNLFNESNKEKASILQTYAYCKTLSRITLVLEQVEKLTQDAKEVQHNLNNLLDLRQKDANLAEAIWARKASEETTRQSRTILVFTVVTIIFLPITFLSSLFALDITSFPHDNDGDLKYSPSWAFSWLIGMTVAVSVPLVLLAFFVNDITVFFGKFVNRVGTTATVEETNAAAAGSRPQRVEQVHEEPDVTVQKITVAKSKFSFIRRGLRKRERQDGEV